jgi:acetyltransferase-like isoleucine patch superfamily enzyme
MNLRTVIAELKLYICNHLISRVPSHTIRLTYYKTVMKFKIGEGSYIFMGCTFDCSQGLTIGQNSVINSNCRVDPRGKVSIGNNVSISNDTIILTADHDMNNNMEGRMLEVTIGDFVWIGTRSMILPGVKINKGSVVAAGSIVTKNIEPNAVVGGVPAKVIKIRTNPLFNYNASYKRLFQ